MTRYIIEAFGPVSKRWFHLATKPRSTFRKLTEAKVAQQNVEDFWTTRIVKVSNGSREVV